MRQAAVVHITAALQSAGLLDRVEGQVTGTATGIADDSRLVVPGGIFVAVRGSGRDGHDYIDAAAVAGAVVAIVEDASRSRLPSLVVRDARRAAAVAASAFYNDPARGLTMVGVTGTNGKTTTVGLVRHLLDDEAAPAASIGTIGVLLGGEGRELPGGSGLTTPGAVELQHTLADLAAHGVRTVAVEASSHALDQHRLDGVELAAGVFTNFSRDHLDYHGTMDAYLAAKSRLVELIGPSGTMVVNADESAWDGLAAIRRRVTFGIAEEADVRATDLSFSPLGSTWTLLAGGSAHRVTLPMIGDFNVANALAAAAAAYALGRDPADVAERLSRAPQVAGRLERLSDVPVVLRDYAHTPDALERALLAIRPFAQGGKLVVVFGCGGDRDAGKRPLMGAIAERLGDHVIITSDNPRTEDPELILDAIEAGMTARRHERIADRHAAIARALELAGNRGDLVLLAGKGHETYQVRGTTKFPFDEAQIVSELVSGRGR